MKLRVSSFGVPGIFLNTGNATKEDCKNCATFLLVAVSHRLEVISKSCCRGEPKTDLPQASLGFDPITLLGAKENRG